MLYFFANQFPLGIASGKANDNERHPTKPVVQGFDAGSVEQMLDYYLLGLLLTFSEQLFCRFNVGFHSLHSLHPTQLYLSLSATLEITFA